MVCGGRGYRGLRPVEVTKTGVGVRCSAAGAEGKARDSGRWGIALRQRLPSKCRRASTMARGVEKSVRGRGAVGKQLQGPGGDYSTVWLLWKFKFLGRSRSAAAVPAKTQKCQRQGCVLIAAPLRDSLAGGPRFSAPCPDHPLLLLPWPVILIAGGHYAGLEVRALPNTRRRRRLAAVTGTALASLPTQGRYLVEASSLWTPAGYTCWGHVHSLAAYPFETCTRRAQIAATTLHCSFFTWCTILHFVTVREPHIPRRSTPPISTAQHSTVHQLRGPQTGRDPSNCQLPLLELVTSWLALGNTQLATARLFILPHISAQHSAATGSFHAQHPSHLPAKLQDHPPPCRTQAPCAGTPRTATSLRERSSSTPPLASPLASPVRPSRPTPPMCTSAIPPRRSAPAAQSSPRGTR